jgi:hypothetical protein
MIAEMKRKALDMPNPNPEKILNREEIMAEIRVGIQNEETNPSIQRKMRRLGVVWPSDEIVRVINEQRKVLKMPESRLRRKDLKSTLIKRWGIVASGFGLLMGGLFLSYATGGTIIFKGMIILGFATMLAGGVSLFRSFF